MPEPIIWLRAEMPLFSSLLQAVLSLILALGVTSLSAGTAGAIEAAVAAVGALIVAIWTTPFPVSALTGAFQAVAVLLVAFGVHGIQPSIVSAVNAVIVALAGLLVRQHVTPTLTAARELLRLRLRRNYRLWRSSRWRPLGGRRVPEATCSQKPCVVAGSRRNNRPESPPLTCAEMSSSDAMTVVRPCMPPLGRLAYTIPSGKWCAIESAEWHSREQSRRAIWRVGADLARTAKRRSCRPGWRVK